MGLTFENITHAFGAKTVIENVSFSAKQGEITCLLGPSGCGKTTLLRIAAGILAVQNGALFLNDTLLASRAYNPPPEQRGVGLVFQDGALFAHLNVEKNISFGIKDRTQKKHRITELLTEIDMSGFEKRYPDSLSGGQKQRVAFARAIAPSPRLLLLDEPFANVDIQLRKSLRGFVRRILKKQNCPIIMVTHDPQEALEMADHLVVMDDGKIIQSGSSQSLYDDPKTPLVEALLGGGQILEASMLISHLETKFGSWPLDRIKNGSKQSALSELGVVSCALRARDVQILPSGGEGAFYISDLNPIGSHVRAVIGHNRMRDNLYALLERGHDFTVGQSVTIMPRQGSILTFSPE